MRIRSKSCKYIALIPDAPATGFSVVVTFWGMMAFNATWPNSRLPNDPIRFEFDGDGNLMGITGRRPIDGERELLALSHYAQAFGEQCRTGPTLN